MNGKPNADETSLPQQLLLLQSWMDCMPPRRRPHVTGELSTSQHTMNIACATETQNIESVGRQTHCNFSGHLICSFTQRFLGAQMLKCYFINVPKYQFAHWALGSWKGRVLRWTYSFCYHTLHSLLRRSDLILRNSASSNKTLENKKEKNNLFKHHMGNHLRHFSLDLLYFISPGRDSSLPQGQPQHRHFLSHGLWPEAFLTPCHSVMSRILKLPQHQSRISFTCPWLPSRIGNIIQSCKVTLHFAPKGCDSLIANMIFM